MAKKFDYPAALSEVSGCKVSWKFYDNLDDAKAAAKVAKAEAEYVEGKGYDFGFCSPGSLEVTPNGNYKVCVP
jgi:hypothetical protein